MGGWDSFACPPIRDCSDTLLWNFGAQLRFDSLDSHRNALPIRHKRGIASRGPREHHGKTELQVV